MTQFVRTSKAIGGVKGRIKRRPLSERYGWFDQWIIARGEPLKGLVRSTTRLVEYREPDHFPRKRARKAVDRANHLRAIEGVVANLAYAVLKPPKKGRLAVNIRHGEKGRSRYSSHAFGTRFSDLLYVLWQDDIIDYKHSPGRREVSSISPSRWFAVKVREAGVTFADFGRDKGEEVIVLSQKTSGRSGSEVDAQVSRHKSRIEYNDTATSRKYRNFVRRLNRFLAQADISFIDDKLEPIVDPFSRTLTRHFALLEGQNPKKPHFDQVGRLSGGFWMVLSKTRRKNIRINGEPVVELDYSSMFTRLAYAELGEQPPPLDDMYAVPGLSGYRSGAKLAMNCFLFDRHSRRSSWPRTMGVGVGNDAERNKPGSPLKAYEGLLPAGWTVGPAKKAILKLHPALKRAWGNGLGYRLMWRESEVLMAVLKELMQADVPALGLHDGLIVAASKKRMAQRVMAEQGKAVTGLHLPVSEKA